MEGGAVRVSAALGGRGERGRVKLGGTSGHRQVRCTAVSIRTRRVLFGSQASRPVLFADVGRSPVAVEAGFGSPRGCRLKDVNPVVVRRDRRCAAPRDRGRDPQGCDGRDERQDPESAGS